MSKTIYITEKQKKQLKNTPSIYDQVDKVRTLCPGLAYEGKINESPDFVEYGANVGFRECNAYPFFNVHIVKSKENVVRLPFNENEIVVGTTPNASHYETMEEKCVNAGIENERGELAWVNFDDKQTGRYWKDLNIISFWDMSSNEKDLIPLIYKVVETFKKNGIDINIEYLLVDFWFGDSDEGEYEGNKIKGLVPFKWIKNGMCHIYKTQGAIIKPADGGEYEKTKKYTNFNVLLPKGRIVVDINGDEIENEWQKVLDAKRNNINYSYGPLGESVDNGFNMKKEMASLMNFMSKRINIKPFPKVILNHKEQDGLFIRTGYYQPETKSVTLFTAERHPKDILRSLAHELIHHYQNLNEPNKDWGNGGNLDDDKTLRKLEGEAYYKGNLLFREWTEYENSHKSKVLKENRNTDIEIWYRGLNSKYGEQKNHLLWLTDDLDYAKKYGDTIMEYQIDVSKCQYGIADVELVVGCIDYYQGPNEEDCKKLLKEGIGCYCFEAGDDESYCMCLWDKSCIVEKRILTPYKLKEDVDFKVKEEKFLRRQAVEIYGITDDFNKAGFILTTGELLDMSNGEEKKSMVHGALDVDGEHMDKFIALGEIRLNVDAPGIEYCETPTPEQYNKIKEFVEWSDKPSFFVDCRNENGSILWSKEYEGKNIDVIVKDIENNGPKSNEVLDGYNITDFLSEDYHPEDIDLSSFIIKKELNPKFWKDGHLDTRIRKKLLNIADDFIEYLGIDWVETEDITMTGSLANFNWDKKYSDIDLHILIDYTDIDDKKEFVSNYLTAMKNEWNDTHKDIKIYGFPVELYVQDINEPHASSGVYSIDKDKWLTKPDRDKLAKMKVNKSGIKNKVAEYMNKIDNLEDSLKKSENNEKEINQVSGQAEKLFDDIKNERRKDLAKTKNEISNGNIIFKTLRRNGYIEKIINIKNKSYNKLNSLS